MAGDSGVMGSRRPDAMRLRGEGRYHCRGRQQGQGEAAGTRRCPNHGRSNPASPTAPTQPPSCPRHKAPCSWGRAEHGAGLGKHRLLLVQAGQGQHFQQLLPLQAAANSSHSRRLSLPLPPLPLGRSQQWNRRWATSWQDRHRSGHRNSTPNVFGCVCNTAQVPNLAPVSRAKGFVFLGLQ